MYIGTFHWVGDCNGGISRGGTDMVFVLLKCVCRKRCDFPTYFPQPAHEADRCGN